MTKDMQRDFKNREELLTYLRDQFPQAAERDANITEIIGGREAAQKILEKVDPGKYGKTRNFFTGAVTRLSPYLRYGVMSLREVRDFALAKARNDGDATKLVNE